MQDEKEKKVSKFDNMFKHVLHLDEKDLRLKFFFDHVRNYGIAATVIVAGFYLIANGSIVSNIPGAGVIFGTLLLLSGFLLMVFNLLHPIWAMVQFKVKMLPYMVISIILFLSASELTWVIIKQTMSRG
jgi:uncharacterized membrane protein YesL